METILKFLILTIFPYASEVSSLDDPSFKVRERATARLLSENPFHGLAVVFFEPETLEGKRRIEFIRYHRHELKQRAIRLLFGPGSTHPPTWVGTMCRNDPDLWAEFNKLHKIVGLNDIRKDAEKLQDAASWEYSFVIWQSRYEMRCPEHLRRRINGLYWVYPDNDRQEKEFGFDGKGWDEKSMKMDVFKSIRFSTRWIKN